MKIKNIIFDFDGTIADTAALIVATMQRTIKELNLPQKTDTQCRAMIGFRLEEVPGILWPDSLITSEQYAKAYRNNFDRFKETFKIRCFPGVIETLNRLYKTGINMAIATSRSRKSLEEYLKDLELNEYFGILIGGSDVVNGKPSPEPVLTILSKMDSSAGETLIVGDMAVDIMMGNRAGTQTCGVTYGNGMKKELADAGADYIIDNFSELIPLLNRIDS